MKAELRTKEKNSSPASPFDIDCSLEIGFQFSWEPLYNTCKSGREIKQAAADSKIPDHSRGHLLPPVEVIELAGGSK